MLACFKELISLRKLSTVMGISSQEMKCAVQLLLPWQSIDYAQKLSLAICGDERKKAQHSYSG